MRLLLIFPRRRQTLAGTELAPATRRPRHRDMGGGCRGVIGPFPQPLWMRYSVVSNTLREGRGKRSRASQGVSEILPPSGLGQDLDQKPDQGHVMRGCMALIAAPAETGRCAPCQLRDHSPSPAPRAPPGLRPPPHPPALPQPTITHAAVSTPHSRAPAGHLPCHRQIPNVHRPAPPLEQLRLTAPQAARQPRPAGGERCVSARPGPPWRSAFRVTVSEISQSGHQTNPEGHLLAARRWRCKPAPKRSASRRTDLP